MGDEEEKSRGETSRVVEEVEQMDKEEEDEGRDDEEQEKQTIEEKDEVDKKKKEIERLQEERRKLAEQSQKEQERAEVLALEKEKVDKIALEGTRTTEELIEAYSRQDQEQKDQEEETSKKSLLAKELSQKIETIREAKGDGDPEIKELEDKLKKLEEEAEADEERRKDISERKAKLEMLLEDHIESLSKVNDKKTSIEDELEELEKSKRFREEEEKKILARLAELRGETTGERLKPSEAADLSSRSSVDKDSRGLYPYDSSVAAELNELRAKGLIAAKAMRALKEEIEAEYLQRDPLTEEDMKTLPLKQNELLSRLAELDEVTKRVQFLMGLAVVPSAELGPPKKYMFLSGSEETPPARTFSQLRPEQILPQVIVCGPDVGYPQIVVCETSKPTDVRDSAHRNGCFDSAAVVHRGTSTLEPNRCSTRFLQGPRPNCYSQMRQGDGLLMRMSSPYYGAGMMASSQSAMGPFGLGQVPMPVTAWMMPSGYGYTMPGSLVMQQQMMQTRILQSASVSSVVPCPCIYQTKRHKKWKKRKSVPQANSCPNLVRADWKYKWN